MKDKSEKVCTTAEAACQLGVTTSRIRQLCLAGDFGEKRSPRVWLIPAEAIDRYMEQRRPPGRPRSH